MNFGKIELSPNMQSYQSLISFYCIPLLFYCSFAKDITILDKSDRSQVAILRTIESGRHEYIAVSELADAFGFSYTIDPIAKQFILNTPKSKIKIFAINPYVLIDDAIHQMPISVTYYNGVYYAPFAYFLFTIKHALPFEFEYDATQNILWLIRPHAKLKMIHIQDKQNGVLIRLSLEQPIKAANIFTSESNGWFYIDLYGVAHHDLSAGSIIKHSAIIDKVTVIKLSNETLRIGLELIKKIKDKQIETRQNPAEVILALRTHAEVPASLLAQLEREREKWRFDVIIIDPGHGGKDPGAIGRSGLKEKDVTLRIAKEIQRLLEKEFKVILTRDSDVFVPLQKRTELANQAKGKLFISIHADSNPNKSLRGHTVYFMGAAKTDEARRVAQFENSVIQLEDSQEKYANLSDAAFILAANAQNSFNKESEEFAGILANTIKDRSGIEGLGVRQAGFYVLYGASMPNVLLETAFISNSKDELLLKSRSFQQLLAESICKSIYEFKARYEAQF